MTWLSFLSGAWKVVLSLLNLFALRSARKQGAVEEAAKSLQEANNDEQAARAAANDPDKRMRVRERFTRADTEN